MRYLDVQNQEMNPKKAFAIMGWAIFAMTSGVMVVGPLIVGLLGKIFPQILTDEWIIWMNLTISFYCIGFSLFYLVTRAIPNQPKGEKKKMTGKEFLTAFIICMAAVYLFNIVGNIINLIIGLLMGGGKAVVNPLLDVVGNASILAALVFVGILSPIVEEVVFRGIMLDKLRPYGERTAIFFTALTFGLFHGNLSQFFYAFALGLIFAYIAVKTNTIKYTVIIHMIINIIGSVIMPAILRLLPIDVMDPAAMDAGALDIGSAMILMGVGVLIFVLVVGVVIAGIILYAKNVGKITLNEPVVELPRGSKKTALYFNLGIVLFYIMCGYMFVSVIMA